MIAHEDKIRNIAIAAAACLLFMTPRAPAVQAGQDRETTFEFQMIASRPNMPPSEIGDPATRQLLVALHRGVAEEALQAAAGISTDELAQRIDSLLGEGLIRRGEHGNLAPTFPVITLADAVHWLQVDRSVVDETALLVEGRLAQIRSRYADVAGFRHLAFEEASFFVLSNVLLDNWQIGEMERAVLGAARPRRAGGNYYLALVERNADDPVDALGVYGNQVQRMGAIVAGVYGNRRYAGPPNLLSLSSDDLVREFGFPEGTSAAAGRQALAAALVARWRDPEAPVESLREAGLKRLDLLRVDGRVAIPIIAAGDQQHLVAMAALLLPDLVAVLNRHRPVLERQFHSSGYDEEQVTFEEFFIWWYHRFYTAVTDRLIERGTIVLPRANGATYLMMID